MKKILQLVLALTVISALCAAVLALVNDVTRGPIAENAARRAQLAARQVLPPEVRRVETLRDPADADVTVYAGYAENGLAGYAVPGASEAGYGGRILLMVGLTPDRTVVGYEKLAANETPGLGAKLADDDFRRQFAGRPGLGLKVRKDGGEVDAITGATITSRAVCGAIADACRRLDRVVRAHSDTKKENAR